MADHDEIGAVRERIADRLFGQMHGQGITSPLLLADAVLDALGLEQVGWRGEYDDEFYDMRYERPEVIGRWEPLFRLAGLSDSPREAAMTADHDDFDLLVDTDPLALRDAALRLQAENERLRALLQRVHDDLLAEFGREALTETEHPDRIDVLFQVIEAALSDRTPTVMRGVVEGDLYLSEAEHSDRSGGAS